MPVVTRVTRPAPAMPLHLVHVAGVERGAVSGYASEWYAMTRAGMLPGYYMTLDEAVRAIVSRAESAEA